MALLSRVNGGAARGLSWRQLFLLFMLALMLFALLRWQPDAWLASQIQAQAHQHGLTVQYEHLHLDGLTLHLDHLSIRSGRMPAPLRMDLCTLTPAWDSLLKAQPAVRLSVDGDGRQLKALLRWQTGYVAISALQADMNVALLQPFWQDRLTLPIHVGGRLIAAGDLLLDAASGAPVDGKIRLTWRSAVTDITGMHSPLGDYQLLLKADRASGKSWLWSISGGSSPKLSGQGAIDMAGPLLQQWRIHGQVVVQPGDGSNTISAMLGGKAMTYAISGALLNPRWQTRAGAH